MLTCEMLQEARCGSASVQVAGPRKGLGVLAWAAMVALSCGFAPAMASAAPGAAAIVSLPPSAGRIVRVDERGSGAGLQQRVILSGDHAGVNAVEIAFGATTPSTRQINAELVARFPGVAMTPLPARLLKNPYGSMHIAIGAPATGGRCLFAWQRIDDVARATGRPTSLFQRATPAVVRIRLCSVTATLDQLAQTSEQLVIGAPGDPDRVLGETRAVALSPLAATPRVMQAEPRVRLAQAQGGGALFERGAGNPGGLIGLMRGYRRDAPVTRARPAARRPQGVVRNDRGGQVAPSVQQAGLLDGWLARRRMDMQRRERRQQPAARARRQAPPAYTPERQVTPRQTSRPKAAPAPRRKVTPAKRRQTPQQARPQQRQIQREAPVVNHAPAIPQGYQVPGGGARYLGPAPGAAPVPVMRPGPATAVGPGARGVMPTPQVPPPVQGGGMMVAPPRPATAAPGAQPGSMGAQPVTRGLDPTLPGRAYRGPGG